MNQLTVETERSWCALCFYLLVDGTLIQNLLECEDIGIPYWLIEGGLPEFERFDGIEERIVAVCGCGEAGCGHTRCRITRSGNQVILHDFIGERDHPRRQTRYEFEASQFADAMRQMTAAAFKERDVQEKIRSRNRRSNQGNRQPD